MPAQRYRTREGVRKGEAEKGAKIGLVRVVRTDYEGGIRREISRRRPRLIREPRVITATIAAPSE